MPFTPSAATVSERRTARIVDNGSGTWTVNASRIFYQNGTQTFKLDLDGTSTDVDSALQAVQNFMRAGTF